MHTNTFRALVRHNGAGRTATVWAKNSPAYGTCGTIRGFVGLDGLVIVKTEEWEVQVHYKEVALGDNSFDRYPDDGAGGPREP